MTRLYTHGHPGYASAVLLFVLLPGAMAGIQSVLFRGRLDLGIEEKEYYRSGKEDEFGEPVNVVLIPIYLVAMPVYWIFVPVIK